MTTRIINGNTYSEFAVVAAKSIPVVSGLQIPPHDHVALTHNAETGDLTQAVYRSGGQSGAVVATITLTYSNGLLSTVTKS